jgi:hypothetical protein
MQIYNKFSWFKNSFKNYTREILFCPSHHIEHNGENGIKMDIIWIRLIILKFYII